jgi:pimeloyl-ACP methyl ester carboxylesterase
VLPSAPQSGAGDPRNTVRLRDGRTLSYLDLGDPDGLPVLFTIGSPSSAAGGKAFAPAAARNGIRLLSIDKPGSGSSTRDPQRSLLRFGADVRDLADALGLGRVALAGQSGGGPHALAAAYVLGDRVSTLSLISSAGPLHEEWAREGLNPLMRSTTWCANHAPPLMALPVGLIKLMMGTPERAQRLMARNARKLGERERVEMTRPEAAFILQGTSETFVSGVGPACDEFRAIGQPWGFRLEDVHAPTDLWHGTVDTSCPIAMARGLARRLPSAELHELDGLGHGFFGPELDAAMAKLRQSEVLS